MRRFGLIGRPLGHSLSQRYFEKKFAAEGIGYNLYELPDITALENLISAVDGLCGLNVTIPYKQSVIPYLDSTDDEAAAVGAVNCIRISNGHLRGYNTDIEGIRSTLTTLLAQRSIEISHTRISTPTSSLHTSWSSTLRRQACGRISTGVRRCPTI